MNIVLAERLIDNYRKFIDAKNFISRTNTIINKANQSSEHYSIDEIKSNELLKYKTTSIKSNDDINNYISELNKKGIKVEFKEFDTAVNKIIIYNKNSKTLEVIEYLD